MAAYKAWATPSRLPARAIAVAAAAAMLIWPALWNGFPLVFADSGTYLAQALTGYLGWDRPIFYSVFLLMTHWGLSLWPPVVAQALLVAYVISISLHVAGLRGAMPLLVTCAALAAFTALPWFVGQLMPDLFVGVLVLSLWLLGFASTQLRPAERHCLRLIAAGSIVVHQAHLPLALLVILVAGGLACQHHRLAVAWRTVRRMVTPALLAVLALCMMNFVGHKRVSLSPFGSVFLAARLIHDGPARSTLDQICPEIGWRICEVRHAMPTEANHFLWLSSSPLYTLLGGPKAWAPEAAALVMATVVHHPGAVLTAAIQNTATQLRMMATGDGLEAWPGVPGPAPLIARYFGHEYPAYMASRQESGELRLDAAVLAPLHVVLAWSGLAALILLLIRGNLDRLRLSLCVLVLAATFGNAALTGALSGPHHRYQARLAWLFILAPGIAAIPLRKRHPALDREKPVSAGLSSSAKAADPIRDFDTFNTKTLASQRLVRLRMQLDPNIDTSRQA